MMSSFRRLAKDHTALRTCLPPNYLFPATDDSDSLPDDLTQLSIHLTGSEGTPYSNGLWLLHLRIPHDYPKSPPKATFKTRIFHPNVEESTGAVCLETLKRDWDPKLTLKDILVTISCLLIQPNPDSALNEKAGVLVREDYDGFVRQAKLMTKIHAPVPVSLQEAVEAARRRGEETDGTAATGRGGKQPAHSAPLHKQKRDGNKLIGVRRTDSDGADSAKENDPSQGIAREESEPLIPKKHVLGKRPLSDLATRSDQEDSTILLPNANLNREDDGGRPRKSPKHTNDTLASKTEVTARARIDNNEMFETSAHNSGTASISLSIIDELHKTRKVTAPIKYRPYARVGIKRL